MKYTLLLLLFISSCYVTSGQNIISIRTPLKINGQRKSVKTIGRESLLKMKNIDTDKSLLGEIKTSSQTDKIKGSEENPDSNSAKYAEIRLNAIADTLNNASPIKILINVGASDIEKGQNINGNVSFGVQLRLTKNKRCAFRPFKNWIDPHYVYAMANTRSISSIDSSNIIKTFLFPEISKRDFVLGYYWEFLDTNNVGIAPNIELGLNSYKDSGAVHIFKSTSLTVGVKVFKVFEVPALHSQAFVQFFPYYNLINVDPKYFINYQILMGESNLHPTFHTFGIQTQIQVDNVSLYCNMKYITNSGDQIQNPELKRFVYTIGTMLSL